jgi:hypothetical protein
MSKKLIAVASAAALALTALVGIAPANATVTLNVTGADSGSGTAADPYLESVPANNLIDGNGSIAVTATASVGDVMTVTSTGGVKILSTVFNSSDPGKLYTSASGTQSYTVSITSTATTKDFVVYNTSTTAGTFTVSLKSATSSAQGSPVYVEGVAGGAYNFNVTAPATLAAGTAGEITFKITDMFGNELEDDATGKGHLNDHGSISGVSAPTLGTVSWSTTRKLYYASLSAVATAVEFVYVLNIPNTDVADIGGLAKPKRTGIFVVNGTTNATAATTAAAQVASLTEQLANSRPKETSVTKKKYNTLARKWNAAFPSQKVALKK